METWGLPANRRVHGRNMKGLKIAYLVTGVSRKGWSWKIPSGRETVCVCAPCLPCLSATVDKKCPGMAQKYLVGFVWMFVGLCCAIHVSPSPAAWRRGDSNHHHHLQCFGAPKHVFARNPGRLNGLCVFFLDRAAESRHLKWCFEWSLCLQRGEGRNVETPEPVTSLSLLGAGARL